MAVWVELSGAQTNSAAGAVGRAKALRYDAFEAELARVTYDLTVDDAGARAEGTRETFKAGEEATALNSMSVINLRTGYCGGDMTEGSQNRKNIKFIVMYVLGVVDMLREWQKLDPTHALPICVPRSVDAGRLIVVVHDYIEATAPWRQQQLDATTSVIGALKATWPCPGARR